MKTHKIIKIVLLTYGILVFNISAMAQYSVSYKYDDNGNRINRYFVGLVFRTQKNIATEDSTKAIENLRIDIMKKGLSVYPNPVKDKVNITLSKIAFDPNKNKADIYLTDALGKSLQKAGFQGEEISFDMSSYLPGIYYLSIIVNDKEKFEYKIVKI